MSDPINPLNAALQGRYRIERELGEGGMATVYLARDERHNRNVALKVLKPELAAVVGADRFLAEITTTANLQHPHILPLFDSGEADGFLFYVMPYVEGESLRERLEREKQLPVDEAVRIATDVAEALHSAHKQGVIHRDVKPANILLGEGRPLVADFGIALAVSAAGGGRLTETGLSMGTPYYMSPEQASADREPTPASDVYSLGCVLYEMLVGDPPHTASSAQAVLAKILTEQAIAPTRARASIPPNVDAAIRKALEKLPADRFAEAGDFARALGDGSFRHGENLVGAAAGSRLWRPWALVATGMSLLATLGLGWSILHPRAPGPLSRLALSLPGSVYIVPGAGLDISPDGSTVVFVGFSPEGTAQLWLRRLDELIASPIQGTEDGRGPRFSPDGQSVVFWVGTEGTLTSTSLSGTNRQTLALSGSQGSAWGSDGMIYFTRAGGGAIWRISDGGGEPTQVTPGGEGESANWDPDVLPDGNGILYSRASPGRNDIAVLSLDTGEEQVLFPGWTARYSESGHILHTTRDGTLLATPFDPVRLETTGPTQQLLEGVWTPEQASHFAVSKNGTLAYLPGVGQAGGTELVWVTRNGSATPVDPDWRFNSPFANYGWSLSPDGNRVAVMNRVTGNTDIWIKELPEGPFERLTFDEREESFPTWTPDGEYVTYVLGEIQALGDLDIWRVSSHGTGQPQLVFDDRRSLYQHAWSSDGEWIIVRTPWWSELGQTAGDNDVLALRPARDTAALPLLASTEFQERGPALSPDARWIAYSSNETGREEVYIRPFPNVADGRERVSLVGGSNPLWANSGEELFFVDPTRTLIAARVETTNGRVAGREPLFRLTSEYVFGDGGDDFYDMATDDQAFLMARIVGAGSGGERPQFIVVQNFFEELRQLAPN